MNAKTHRSKPRKRKVRAAKTANARDAIGKLEPGAELYILTYGQFSLIDALVALVEQTGPAHVDISTWTAANADLTTASRLLEGAEILSLRMLVDRSFLTRQPEYCATMRDLFGDESIRTARTHAKFLTIHNDDWNLAVRTSMNLNHNPRLENIEISDDRDLRRFLTAVVDEIYEEQPVGVFSGELPLLDGVPELPMRGRVASGKVELKNLKRPAVGPGTSGATS